MHARLGVIGGLNFMSSGLILKRKILLYPDGNSYSIKELEERLNFKYLIKNSFETHKDKSTVRAKGIQKFNNG